MFKGLTRREFIKAASMAALAMAIPIEVFAADGGKPADTVIYGNFYTVDKKIPRPRRLLSKAEKSFMSARRRA